MQHGTRPRPQRSAYGSPIGIGSKAERKRLEGLVKLALGPTEALDALPADDGLDERLAKLAELKGWYDEWAATARAVVKKRVHLIRVGLARRGAIGRRVAERAA